MADGDGNAARFGELDGVAAQVEQDLAQPVVIAFDQLRNGGGHVARYFDALGMGAWRQEFGYLFDQAYDVEGLVIEFELSGFDFGRVQQLIDDRQQGPSG